MKVIARSPEQERIHQLLRSDKPELVAVYGRRRVGKTFIVSQTLQENTNATYFEFTGSLLDDGKAIPIGEFLTSFSLAWQASQQKLQIFQSILQTLSAIVELASQASDNRPLHLFFDEIPWIATSSPEFFRGLVNIWNTTLSKKPYVKVFVAGSSTAWMMENIIQAKTGLAKRVTAKLPMKAFSLKQTQTFLHAKGFDLPNNDIIKVYSALGGIPYYLDALTRDKSPHENLYHLLATEEGLLSADSEYEQLFKYLFSSHTSYLKVINTLVKKKYGFSLAELSREFENKDKASGHLRRILKNLQYSELIEKRMNLFNPKRGGFYFVSDEYIRFVSKWLLDGNIHDYAAFNNLFSSPSYLSWQGFNFELIAYKNHDLIIDVLGLRGISVTPYVYYHQNQCQIDMLLARSDQTITLCEAKSCDGPYEPTAQDVMQYRQRKQLITEHLKSKRMRAHYINYCFITRNGIKKNRYFHEINPLHVELLEPHY